MRAGELLAGSAAAIAAAVQTRAISAAAMVDACAVPVWGCHATMPIGVQIVAAPWREDLVLRVAHQLQQAGVVRAPVVALIASR